MQESFKDIQKKIQAWTEWMLLDGLDSVDDGRFFSSLAVPCTQHEDPGRNWKIYVAHAPGKWTTSVVCRPVCSVCQQGNES